METLNQQKGRPRGSRYAKMISVRVSEDQLQIINRISKALAIDPVDIIRMGIQEMGKKERELVK